MKFTEKKTQEKPLYPMLMKHGQYGMVMLAIDKNRGIVMEDNRDNAWKVGTFIEYQNFEREGWQQIHGTIEF